MLEKAPVSIHSSAHAEEGEADEQELSAMQIIENLGGALYALRQEALNWRAQTGIEDDWNEDEEFYDARDNANPEGETNVGKPLSPNGGAENRAVPTGRSSVFIPITRAYVDAAAARVADMLLPNDDPPWKLQPTPRPDMAAEPGGGMTPVAGAAAGVAGTGPMPQIPGGMPGMLMPPPQDPAAAGQESGPSSSAPAGMGAQPGMPAPDVQGGVPPGPITSSIYEALPEDEKRAEQANKVIADWLVECQWHAEARKAIEDAAKLGTGILKGPFPMQVEYTMNVYDPVLRRFNRVTRTKTVPVTKRVHPRNFWSDPAGGECHQKGSYTWELDNIGSRQLRQLLKDETYIRENILRALREGPGAKSGKDVENPTYAIGIGATFPLWYFTGDVTKEIMVAAGVPEDMLPEGDNEAVSIPALIIMCNDHVIKVTPAALDNGGFPYDVFTWQSRPGIPWGKGVARQMRTPQRMLNGAVRAEMDNAGLSSGPQWAIRKRWVQAIDGNNSSITPRKGWHITEDAPPNVKLEDCISFTNITGVTAELERIIDRAMRFAEDATGLPMLMQGQQGEATTTATGMTILNNNGSTVLRRIARTFDDQITEPHIRRYYEWLMANDGNDDAKGDFQIDARGSTYLVDRELQAQNLNLLYPALIQNPDIHPGRLGEEVAMANRLPLERIKLTDAEKRQRDSQPPPKPPQIEVAEIRREVDMAKLQQKEGQDKRMAQVAEGTLQATVEKNLGDLAIKAETLDTDSKLQLAIELMRQAQGERQGAAQRQHESKERGTDRQHERISAIEAREGEPPAEPKGRAPAGAAFTQ
jgi:hypothetical protein